MLRSCWLIAVCSGWVVSPSFAENWPTWRGPRQDGTVSDQRVPVQWTPEDVTWKVPLPGQGTSSPIIWNGRVFVTATTGREHAELLVRCHDLTTGALHWERRLSGHPTPVFAQFPPLRGHALPSPVTDGERLVVLFSTGETAAFDLDGRPLWFRSLQEDYGEIDNDYGLAASPVIVEDRVLFQVDQAKGSYLLSVDADSGRTVWKTERAEIGENWTTPLVLIRGAKTAVVCAGSRLVQAYETSSGTLLWSSDNLARLCCPMPIAIDDRLILTSGPGGNVQSLQLGRELTVAPVRQWSTPKGAGFVPSAVCLNGLYFYANDRGILTCLDQVTGEEVWTHRLEGAGRGSPVAAGRMIYFTNLEGRTTVIEAAREYREVGIGLLSEGVSATPAISQGRLVFRTAGHLLAIGGK